MVKGFFFCRGSSQGYSYRVSGSQCSTKHNLRRLTQGEEHLTLLHNFPPGFQEDQCAALDLEHSQVFVSLLCRDVSLLFFLEYPETFKENEASLLEIFPSFIADTCFWLPLQICHNLTFSLQMKEIPWVLPGKRLPLPNHTPWRIDSSGAVDLCNRWQPMLMELRLYETAQKRLEEYHSCDTWGEWLWPESTNSICIAFAMQIAKEMSSGKIQARRGWLTGLKD